MQGKVGRRFGTRRVTVRLPTELADALDVAAHLSGLTVSDVIKAILAHDLGKLQKPSPLTTEEVRAIKIVLRASRQYDPKVVNQGLIEGIARVEEMLRASGL